MVEICVLGSFSFVCVDKIFLPGARQFYNILLPVGQFHPPIRSQLGVEFREPRRGRAKVREVKVI